MRLQLCLMVLLGWSASSVAAEEFVSLFNGRDLSGWKQHGGKAQYSVEDGCVVGRAVPNTSNSFLCTEKTYGNFVFEFEFLVGPTLNSGVQFRSQVFDQPQETKLGEKTFKFAADRVHGYQYEIDPSPRSYSAGVYDEGRRGWLQDLKDNEPARKAFLGGQWNRGRIECRGDAIQTWINDVPAAKFTDSVTPRGLIALQVHGVGKEAKPDQVVRWRNLRIKELP